MHGSLILHVAFVFSRISSGDLQDIVFSDLFGFFKFGKNGELRTYEATKSAFNAIFRLRHNLWRVISLCVEPFALFKASVGAKLDAKATPLASIFNDMHRSMWNRVRLGIKWQSPEFHSRLTPIISLNFLIIVFLNSESTSETHKNDKLA